VDGEINIDFKTNKNPFKKMDLFLGSLMPWVSVITILNQHDTYPQYVEWEYEDGLMALTNSRGAVNYYSSTYQPTAKTGFQVFEENGDLIFHK
jgi:hypothetical protein